MNERKNAAEERQCLLMDTSEEGKGSPELALRVGTSQYQSCFPYKDDPRTVIGQMRRATEYAAANCAGVPNLLVIQCWYFARYC